MPLSPANIAARLTWQLLPGECLLCGLPSHQHRDLCTTCADDLPAPGEICQRCGTPKPEPRLPCPACRRQRPPWQSLTAACSYREPADLLVQLLKFRRQRAAARVMAEVMHSRLDPDGWRGLSAPVLVPVPLHPWRLWQRGFNQCRLIGYHLSRLRALPEAPAGLRRKRRAPAQSRLSRSARQVNLNGAFQGGARHLRGRDCILVDDVMTTGATLEACTHAALSAGAASVHAWVFALTPAPAV